MLTTIFAYILITFFFATEGRARKGQQAQNLQQGQFDQKSTVLIGVAFLIAGLGMILAPILNFFGIGHLAAPHSEGWIGVLLATSGIVLRLWANRILGEFYTRTLLVTNTQYIVQEGPYRLIRHPGYLGSIMMWTGAGLATANAVAIAVIVVVILTAYSYRIQAEERMLEQVKDEAYRQYQSRTWKLLPPIF